MPTGTSHSGFAHIEFEADDAKALDELVKAGDALTDTLTEKQKEVFEDYMTAQREVNVLTDCETFIYTHFVWLPRS